MELSGDLIKIYDKCCEGYHKVDDFRSKLLGLVPLASGIAILGSMTGERKFGETSTLVIHHLAIGVFGFVVTLGLRLHLQLFTPWCFLVDLSYLNGFLT